MVEKILGTENLKMYQLWIICVLDVFEATAFKEKQIAEKVLIIILKCNEEEIILAKNASVFGFPCSLVSDLTWPCVKIGPG